MLQALLNWKESLPVSLLSEKDFRNKLPVQILKLFQARNAGIWYIVSIAYHDVSIEYFKIDRVYFWLVLKSRSACILIVC